MKKLVICLAGLIAINFCAAQSKLSKSEVLTQFENVGINHNKALDYFYSYVEANKATFSKTSTSRNEKLAIISKVIGDKTSTNPIFVPSPTYPEPSISIINNELLKVSNAYNTSANSKGAKTMVQATIEGCKLTPVELEYVNDLLGIVAQSSSKQGALEEQLNAFNEKVFVKFGVNSNSTYMLLAGSFTAKYSAKYWNQGSPKWVTMGKSLGGDNAKMACCGGLVSADVSGAIGGAIGGAFAGAVAGGVGAGPGAVAGAVAGGIGGSVTQAVSNLINWLF